MPGHTIAFDLGTRCGYASSAAWPVPIVGAFDLRPRRFEGGGMRFLKFRGHLKQLFDDPPDRVVYEEVRRHLGTDAAHVYGGLQAILTEECETRGIPYEAIPVGTIKKHATGRGNADKQTVYAAARARWPNVILAGDDEADALWLLDYAMSV